MNKEYSVSRIEYSLYKIRLLANNSKLDIKRPSASNILYIIKNSLQYKIF